MSQQARIDEFWQYVVERHAIYERRLKGQLRPWTSDVTLHKHRFCNVYRWLDPTSIALINVLRTKNSIDEVAFSSMAFRLVTNRFWVLETYGLPERLANKVECWLETLRLDPRPTRLATHYNRSWQNVAITLSDACNKSLVADSPSGTLDLLKNVNGIGSFYGTQIIGDLIMEGRIGWPHDVHVRPGPGARGGLYYLKTGERLSIYGHKVINGKRVAVPRARFIEYSEDLKDINQSLFDAQPALSLGRLSYVDIEQNLCEFLKYLALKEGGSGRLYKS